jgi:large subunit ribosomal protein L23Ae
MVRKVTKRADGRKVVVRVHNKPHFYKPATKKLLRKPRYMARAASQLEGYQKINTHDQRADGRTTKVTPASVILKMDQFRVIKFPLTTESAMKKIEDNNTLVFIVDKLANKRQIKAAVNNMYHIEVQNVNTLIRPDGKKKAYVRLTPDYDALDVANKIGII